MKVNSRVVVMREAIKHIVPMLSAKGVKVTQQGMQAYVQWHPKTLEPVRVNLPYLPDDATDELLDALQGFLDHEVGHILFTDSKSVVEAAKKKAQFLANVIEDTFIERKMADRFPGSQHNLQNVRRFFLREVIDRDLKAHPDMAEKILLVPAFRAWSGQSVFIEYMKDKWHLVKELTDRLGTDIPKQVPLIRDSWGTLELALECKKRLMHKAPEDDGSDHKFGEGEPGKGGAPAPAPVKPQEGMRDDTDEDPDAKKKPGVGGESSDEENDESESDPKDDGDKKKGKDKESKDKESKDKKEKGKEKGKDKKDKGEEKAPGAGDADDKKDEKAENKKDSAGDKKKDDKKDKVAPVEKPGAEGAESAGEGEDEKESDGGEAGDGDDEGEGEGEGKDKAEGTGKGAGDGEGKSKGEKPADDATKTDDAGSPESGGTLVDGKDSKIGPSGEYDPKYYEDLAEGSGDFDKDVGEKLTESALEAAKDAEYIVFTRDEDIIEPLDVDRHGYKDFMLESLMNGVDHLIGPLQKDMERAIAARSASVWTSGHRAGRLHGGSLFRMSIREDEDRVFRRKQINETKDVAVSIVVDCSGSMWGGKIELAGQAGYALSSVLDRMNINHEVIGFTTASYSREIVGKLMEESEKYDREYSRLEKLYMPVFKGFNERLTPDVKRRFAVLGNSRFCSQNVDGESVQIAAYRLLQQRQKRKVMLVLSDGQPACPGDQDALRVHLKAVVKDIKKMGVDVVGVGIMDASVKQYYPKYVVLNNLTELPNKVMGEIKRLLLN